MKKVVWIIKNIEEIVAVAALSGMLVTTILNVMMRYIFSNSQAWATEASLMCMIWTTFIGAAVCWKKNMHYGMDFIADSLPHKLQFFLHRAIVLGCMILFVFLSYISYEFTITSTKTTAFFRLPYSYLNVAALLGFISMAIYSGIYFVQSYVNKEKFNNRYSGSYESSAESE